MQNWFNSMLNKFSVMLEKFKSLISKAPEGPPFALPEESSGTLHQTILMIERLAENKHYAFALASCQHRVGTSSLTWSMARTYSEITEKRIVVVETNMHTPILGKVLGLDEQPGFREFVSGSEDLDDVVQQPDGESFSVITAGNCNSVSKKVISKTNLESALGKIRDRFEIIRPSRSGGLYETTRS